MVSGLAVGLPAFQLRSAPWAAGGVALFLVGLLLVPKQKRGNGAADDDPIDLGDLRVFGDVGDQDSGPDHSLD